MTEKNKRKERHRIPIGSATLFAIVFLFAQPNKAIAQQCQWNSGTGTITQTCGSVGIGTTSPGRLLEILGNSNPGIRITNSGAENGAFLLYTRNTTGAQSGKQLAIFDENQLIDRLVIDSAGNIGFGNTSPAARLHLRTGTAGEVLRVDNGGNAGWIRFDSSGIPKGFVGFGDSTSLFNGAGPQSIAVRAENALHLGGSAILTMTLVGGNVGIGTTAPAGKLHVVGAVQVDGNITNSGNISAMGTISGGNVIAKYQDIAEWVPASKAIPVATVVVLDSEKSNHVLASSRAYDTRVAGVVSARPGVILGEAGEGKVMVATTGRVKIKVDAGNGPIRVGDLLVTSDKEGIAMKSLPLDLGGTPIHRPGTLIGKALEPLEKGVGEILVLISLQ